MTARNTSETIGGAMMIGMRATINDVTGVMTGVIAMIGKTIAAMRGATMGVMINVTGFKCDFAMAATIGDGMTTIKCEVACGGARANTGAMR